MSSPMVVIQPTKVVPESEYLVAARAVADRVRDSTAAYKRYQTARETVEKAHQEFLDARDREETARRLLGSIEPEAQPSKK